MGLALEKVFTVFASLYIRRRHSGALTRLAHSPFLYLRKQMKVMCVYGKKLAKKEAWGLDRGLKHKFNFTVNVGVQKHEEYVCSIQTLVSHCGSRDGLEWVKVRINAPYTLHGSGM